MIGIRNAGDNRAVNELSDRLTIKDFTNSNRAIENISFADDTTESLSSWVAGTASNDNLVNTTNNNRFFGGTGNDKYSNFGKKGSQDTITDYDTTVGNHDTVMFDSGVSADQLWFMRSTDDLEISVIGASDKVTIKNWYLGDAYHIESFVTSDAKQLIHTDVERLVQAMSSFAPPTTGQTSLSANVQSAIAPILAVSWSA